MKIKNICAIGLFVLVFVITTAAQVFAAGCEPDTINNTYVTQTDRQDFGYGIGIDAPVYKSKNPLLSEVVVESRYDIDNREGRVFGVVRVDIWDALNNK